MLLKFENDDLAAFDSTFACTLYTSYLLVLISMFSVPKEPLIAKQNGRRAGNMQRDRGWKRFDLTCFLSTDPRAFGNDRRVSWVVPWLFCHVKSRTFFRTETAHDCEQF